MPTSVQSFGLDGLKRILKDVLGIDIQGLPSGIDLLDSLANGLLTKLGDKAKEYVKTIKDGIAKLKENLSDDELLSIILKTGTKNKNVKHINFMFKEKILWYQQAISETA